MSTFSDGNNEEYLVHIIVFKRLIEQKGTAQDVKKAFEVLVEVRRELQLLLKASDNETKTVLRVASVAPSPIRSATIL
jgi:hypothetical protein